MNYLEKHKTHLAIIDEFDKVRGKIQKGEQTNELEKIAKNIENSILVKNTDFQEIPILDAKNMCYEAYQKIMAKKFEDIRLFEPNYIINNYVKN